MYLIYHIKVQYKNIFIQLIRNTANAKPSIKVYMLHKALQSCLFFPKIRKDTKNKRVKILQLLLDRFRREKNVFAQNRHQLQEMNTPLFKQNSKEWRRNC